MTVLVMTREIKFRAWALKDYGRKEDNFYVPANSMVDWETIQDDRNHWLREELFGIEFVLVQYTNLKDWHKKEIYEKDIVQFTRTDEIPKIFDSIEVIENMWEIRDHCWEKDVDYQDVEVIGNIYENKDLINDCECE